MLRLTLVVVFAVAAVNALHQSISICCDDGTEYANTHTSCAGLSRGQVTRVLQLLNIEDIADCHTVMRSCCQKELQRYECMTGVNKRANVGSCDMVEEDECHSVEKTCCECCELGIKVHNEGASCEGFELGAECGLAFVECCERAGDVDDVDECLIAEENDHMMCHGTCVNLIGFYVCECPSGYVLDQADNMTCVVERESDPCHASSCEHVCEARGNRFLCTCLEGYVLEENGVSCKEETFTSPECIYADCSYNCRQTDQNSIECYCPEGYDLDNDGRTCIDINECNRISDICPTDYTCQNEPGTYRCYLRQQTCTTGRKFNAATSLCEDIDECLEKGSCPPHELCQNYPGSYYCEQTSCQQGQYIDRITLECQDIDECALGLHDCVDGQRCDNRQGSYTCTRISPCGTGYTVDSETQQCRDIDECQQGNDDCLPAYYCQNTIGNYRCHPCPQGFKADATDVCSVDIDECEEQDDVCPPGNQCLNNYGGYECMPNCPRGFQFETRYRECRDINECVTGLANCRSTQVCRNTDGSFECECRTGLEIDYSSGECVDINECQKGTHNCRPYDQCYNFEGSFTCQQRCGKNYRYNETLGCVDINECESTIYPCLGNSECVNSPGSFYCRSCGRGMVANFQQRSCEDIDECRFQGVNCVGGCRNTPGSYLCTCPSGYEQAGTYNCRDIDECLRNIHNCSAQSACFNTKGGFKCKYIQCPKYYRKDINNGEVRCVKVTICPNYDLECIREDVKLITFSKIALPTVRRAPTNPAELLKLQIGDLLGGQAERLRFALTQGNELSLFTIVKSTQRDWRRISGEPRYLVIGTLYLTRAIVGPYETDLRLEINLTNPATQSVSVTAAIFSIDVGPHPF